jgi:TRAP-type transport system periplasmic protein
MAITGGAIIGWYAPKYAVLEAPFLFRDYEHLDKVLCGQIGKEIETAINKKHNIHFLASFHRGPRYLTTTNKRIYSPEDLSGLKLRVPELPIYIRSWATFSANPTPIAYSDMFMALKQGVVEGQENPLEVIYTSHLYEVQKYIMETTHLLGFYMVSVGDNFFEKYSKEEQRILTEAIKDAAEYQNSLLTEYEKKYKEMLIESGIKFIEVDREAFEQLALQKLPMTFKRDWAPGIFQSIRKSN